MNKNKLTLTIVISIILLSLNSAAVPLSAEYHRVSGYLYINDVIAPEGIEVILSFEDEDLTDHTNINGHYQIDFVGHEGEEGVFTVFYMGEYLIPDDNQTVEIINVPAYHIDLHVTWTGPGNNPPDKPSLIAPENGSTVDSSNSATLKVKVTDPDDDTMDVYFYDNSDNSLIDKVTGVVSGGAASVLWSGLSPDKIYFWYAIADDSEYESKSDVWNFKTNINQPPDKPSNPYPEDGAQDIDINPYLSVDVTDPDGDMMEVSFYNADDDSLIGIDYDVVSGGTASVPWNDLSYNTVYSWYTIADDSIDETKSDTWSFTTKNVDNKKPKVSITRPEKGLYIFNKKILPRFIRPALIIGTITVTANATDEDSGIEKVVFYINGKKKFEDTTEPYEFIWKKDRIRLFHIFIIKVVAYDNDGATVQDRMLVRKFL